MSDDAYVTIKQASEILGVTPLTLRNWDKSGKFQARRHPMNNYRVYKLSDLERLFDRIEKGNIGMNSKSAAKKLIVKHLEEHGL